jgi:autotransporter-associated beta strand protein
MTKKPTLSLNIAAVLCCLFAGTVLVQGQSTWNATNNVSVNTNWSTATNWLPSGVPGSSSVVLFTNNTAVADTTINNVVDASITISSIQYGHTNSFHNTLILPNMALNVTGAGGLFVGSTNDFGVGVNATATITGAGGALNLNNSGAILNASLGRQTGTNNSKATLDLSGLDSFNCTCSNIYVGVDNSTGTSRQAGQLNLARTNIISLARTGTSVNPAAIAVGHNGNNGGNSSTMLLGQTNAIFADTLVVGGRKQAGCLLRFNSVFSNPVAYIRGKSASRVSVWDVGDLSQQSNTSSSASGTNDFSLGTLNAMADTMYIGRSQSGSTANTGTAAGVFTLGTGILDVNTLQIGFITSSLAGTGTGTAVGTVNVLSGGTLTINTACNLGNNTLGGVNVPTATLIVSGGTVNGAGTIATVGVATNAIVINNGGIINISGGIGASGALIGSVSVTNSTLALVASASPNAFVSGLNVGGTTNTIGVSSMPAISSYPAQFPLIKYSTLSGDPTILGMQLPAASPSFQGYISNNVAAQTIDVVVTGGPAPAKPVTWTGQVSADWDLTTANWKNSGNSALYAQNDFVLFDDTATGLTTINLTGTPATLTPGSLTVNNSAKSYQFTGTGGIGGSAGLAKTGAGSLVLNNSGNNTFSGGVGIGGGTLQVGNGNANGNLPSSGGVTNNASLVFNRSDTLTVGNIISGAGTVTNNGSGTLTLSGANTFGGGLTVNAGTVRLGSVLAPGTGASMTVNPGGTLVLGAAHTNALVLAGGTVGTSVAQNSSAVAGLTAVATTTTTLYKTDPQNLGGSEFELIFTNTLSGSGNLLILEGTNKASPDGGGGFRLRGTGPSTYGGTITLGNNVKGEIQSAVPGGPFSPAGTGKFVMTAGAYYGTNGLVAPVVGGYSELNVRNNTNDTVFGNDVEITGSGLAILNMAGSGVSGATAASTMGNLKVSGGQTVGVYKASGNAQVVKFTSATLTGGNPVFAPFIPGFGALTAVNSDLSLGPISELAPSGIVMSGFRTLYLTGANAYSGNTVVNSGTLALSGSGSITNSSKIIVGADPTMTSAILDASGRSDKTLALVSGQTLYLTNAGWLGANPQTINVGAGATLSALGRTNGTLTLTSGQTLKGIGTVLNTNIVVSSGATIIGGASVGTLNTGPETWNGGGTNVWELSNATGGPGIGWDLLNITGGLDVESASSNAFAINVVSLSGSSPGPAVNFNNNTNYSWTIVSVTDSVTNFDASKFTLNYSAVSNDLAGGYFFLQSGSLKVSFTNNHPPTAAPATFLRSKGLPLKISLAALATNWSDLDADPVALVSVNSSSTNGVNNVTTNGTEIFYTPGTGGDVPDAITYTIQDVRSTYRPGDTIRTTVGTILIAIAPVSTTGSHNITGITTNANGTVTVGFAGVPNETYIVQGATNVAAPVWVSLSTNVAGTNGLWNFTDLDAPKFPSRFYRSMHP